MNLVRPCGFHTKHNALSAPIDAGCGAIARRQERNCCGPLRSARDWFEPAIKQAKIEHHAWHCNRHTFASRLVMAGVDIRTVAQLMGHATIQMTMRYAHLAPEREQLAVERLVSFGVLVPKSVTGQRSRKQEKTKPAIK